MSSQTVFVTKATTDFTCYVDLLQDNSGTNPGDPLTGLVYNSTGLVCYYVRPLAAAVQLTLATQTVTGAHSDGGFVEVSAANTPGKYRLDFSDAILATGVDYATIELSGYADLAPHTIHVVLTDIDLYDGVRGGLTALPASGTLAVNPTLAAVTHTGAVIPTVSTLTGHTPQTGDAYAIVSDVAYGNAQLVRSTTPANTYNIDANGRADVGSWLGTAVTTSSITNKPETDMYSISNDAGAANRLELFSEFGGYTDGFVHINTVNGAAGTDDYENGTELNDVDSLADAITIAISIGLFKFKVSNDSSITFVEAHASEVWDSQGATLVIGSGAGNDVSKTHFYHFSTISGVGTCPTGEAHVNGGHVGNLELGIGHLTGCALTGTYTLGAAANHVVERCYQENGTASIFDMNSLGGSHLSIMSHNGSVTINNILAGDTIELNGNFGDIILNGADATVDITGIAATVTDNRTGTPLGTDSSVKASEVALILADTNELQGNQGNWVTATGFATETKQDIIDTNVDTILAGVTVTDAGGNKIADHVLRRAFATAAASADGDAKSFRSLLGAIAKLVNKVSISGTTLTITEADDATSLGTQTLTTDAAADPITGADTD